MSSTWLLIDAPCLLHRAWHTVGKLEHNDQPTGVIFGFLKQVQSLQSRFQTRQVAFAFEGKGSKRREVSKAYKARRKPEPRSCASCSYDHNEDMKLFLQCHECMEADDRDRAEYEAFTVQVEALKREHLPAMGHKNVFWEDGFEADDVLASLVRYSLKDDDEAVIVSSDHDLYQMLSDRVSMWLPHKKELYREADFREQWGISPAAWPSVLAWSGCPGDGVTGIKGVGCKTACKFVLGELKAKSKAHLSILEGSDVFRTNLPLVSLPYPGTPIYLLRDGTCTPGRWRALCKQLGFDSLLNNV